MQTVTTRPHRRLHAVAVALGEEFGLVGRWVVGAFAFVGVAAGLEAAGLAGHWAVAAAVLAGLATVDGLKRLRDDLVRCPHCRERHSLDASICPHCQRDLPAR